MQPVKGHISIMKSLENLTNADKAALIFDLFPGQMPGYLQHALRFYDTLEKNKEELSASWDNGFITLPAWCSFAQYLQKIITEQGNKLLKQRSLFVAALFDGYGFLVAIHCMLQYAKSKGESDPKFKSIVITLF
jgi:hypothetical protein